MDLAPSSPYTRHWRCHLPPPLAPALVKIPDPESWIRTQQYVRNASCCEGVFWQAAPDCAILVSCIMLYSCVLACSATCVEQAHNVHCHGNAMAVPCTVMAVSWQCHGCAMALATMAPPWHCHGIATVLPWHCHGTAMALPWL